MPKLTFLIICPVILLLLLQVIVANRLTSAGLTLNEIEKERQTLLGENELLERRIATFSSLTQISQRASAAGFKKAQTYYLSPEFPVAASNLNVSAR